MDFASAREWLDEMLDFSATAHARQMLAQGKSNDEIMRALTFHGVSRKNATKAIWRARTSPNARPMAPIGTATGAPVMVRIAPESIETLREAAAKRGISLCVLTSKIVAIVVEDEMIDAVLDDQT
jgi:hypothetical protein